MATPAVRDPQQTAMETHNIALCPDIVVRGDDEEGKQYGCRKAVLRTLASIKQIMTTNPDATIIDVLICESDDSLMTILHFLHYGELCKWTDKYHYAELTHYTDLFNVCMEQELYELAALVVNAVDKPSYRTHCDRDLEAHEIIDHLYENREDPDPTRDLPKQYRKTVLRTQAMTFVSEFRRADFDNYEKMYPGFLLDFTDGMREHLFGKG